ncbi:MAG: hypothetical protein JW909_03050 [Planctomycetes bacterium]|nr:hypothetical protein [Planctomycetota bacterium]
MEVHNHVHEHVHDAGGLVAEGLWWAFFVILGAFVIAGGILLTKYMVVRFSPRRLCGSCNRYYSKRRSVCPFCGAAGETEGGKGETLQNKGPESEGAAHS